MIVSFFSPTTAFPLPFAVLSFKSQTKTPKKNTKKVKSKTLRSKASEAKKNKSRASMMKSLSKKESSAAKKNKKVNPRKALLSRPPSAASAARKSVRAELKKLGSTDAIKAVSHGTLNEEERRGKERRRRNELKRIEPHHTLIVHALCFSLLSFCSFVSITLRPISLPPRRKKNFTE